MKTDTFKAASSSVGIVDSVALWYQEFIYADAVATLLDAWAEFGNAMKEAAESPVEKQDKCEDPTQVWKFELHYVPKNRR